MGPRIRIVAAACALVAAACGGGDGTATEPTPTPAITPTAAPTTEPSATPAPSPDPTVEPTSAPTATPSPEPDPCDPAGMFAIADDTIELGRLEPAETDWGDPYVGSPFFERARSPSEFADANGLDCAVTASHRGPDDAERHVLAAWTGDRYAFVIGATDAPPDGYADDQLFDFLSEQVFAESLATDAWAAILEDGSTLLLRVDGYSTGATAKTWQAAFPEPPPGELTLASERYAVAALEAAGARNVGIAQPPSPGSEIASLAFQTPEGAVMIATVGPTGWFEPDFTSLSGTQRAETVGGVTVFVTEPGPDDFAGAEAGFACAPADYVWRIELGFGDTEELVAWTTTLLDTIGCADGTG